MWSGSVCSPCSTAGTSSASSPAGLASRRRVVWPSVHDPRLQLAAVIISLQVLGQAGLGFELSIAQILVAVGTCAAIEVAWVWSRTKVVVWPASALLTGNGVAFILRVPGTRHGDWWSLHGAWLYAVVGAGSLLTKYVLRFRGRQLFNPSNVGLVVAFLLLGSRRANPQDLWWGPMRPALVVTFLVIGAGAAFVVRRLRLLGMAVAFWAGLAGGAAVVAATGHCFSARWQATPVCGQSFWWVVVTSPEVLVFLFFMITDPRTAPDGRWTRVAFGAAVGMLAALLIAPERTEFSTKVAILGALVVVCAVTGLGRGLRRPSESSSSGRSLPAIQRVAAGLAVAGLWLVALAVAGGPARPSATGLVNGPDVAVPPIAVAPGTALADRALTPAELHAIGQVVVRSLPAPASRLTVSSVRSKSNPQAPPQIEVRAVGPGLDTTVFLVNTGGQWSVAGSQGA